MRETKKKSTSAFDLRVVDLVVLVAGEPVMAEVIESMACFTGDVYR